MELIGLDKNFESVGYIPYINLQWNRRYYEVGTWTAQICAADYDPRVMYVYSPERPELGLYERMETQNNINGRFVLLSGRFLECIYDRQIAFPHITGSWTLPLLADWLTGHQWYKPDLYTIAQDPDCPTDTVDLKWERQPIGGLLYDTLKTLEMGFRLDFDPVTHGLMFKIWKGKDRTQSQTENSYALFSEDSCFVSSLSYVEDWSDYKNVVMVLYGDQPSRKDIYGVNVEEDGRRWLLMNSGESGDNATMQQEAREEMQKHPVVQEAQVDVIQDPDGLLYMKDYDLGDKCDIVIHEYQKAFEARISGINEVFKQGKHTVKLLFGEQAQTTYEKMRNYVNDQRKALGLTIGLNDGGSWTT